MSDLCDEILRLELKVAELQREHNELRGALERLLAKPRCGACRRAASAVLLRIKPELVIRTEKV